MLKLTPAIGTEIYINPDHIVYFWRVTDRGITRLKTVDGETYDIQETPEDITTLIKFVRGGF